MGLTAEHSFEQIYPAVAESIGAGRRAVAAFAAEAGMAREQLEAVRLAASEALTNVVKHAYPDGEGSVHLSAALAGGELCVLVADQGSGFRPHLPRRGLGLGLSLMTTMCDQFQIVRRGSGGTELRMWFKLEAETAADDQPRGSAASAASPARSRFSTTTQPWPESTTVSSRGTS